MYTPLFRAVRRPPGPQFLRHALSPQLRNAPPPARPLGLLLPLVQARFAAKQATEQIRQRAQPSYRLMQQREDLPRDMGLLPFTFIPPTGANLPSIFSADRYKLWGKRILYNIYNIRDLIAVWWFSKFRARYFEPKHVAVSLYKNMYTAFAEANLDALREVCNDGVYESFKGRLAVRSRNQNPTLKHIWTLHSHSRPKLVSNQAVYFMAKDTIMWQAVIRIKSKQSLTKYTMDGDLVKGTGEKKDVTEYVVLQKHVIARKEGPWVVWGTTEETTLPVLKHAEENSFRK